MTDRERLLATVATILARLQEKLDSRLDEKGEGYFRNRHEAFGVIAEEHQELLEQLRDPDQVLLHAELLDLGVAVVWSLVSLDAAFTNQEDW